MKNFSLIFFMFFFHLVIEAQPCTYRDSFKPTTTSTCATYIIGPYVGWTQFCTGTGYTGSGRYTVVKVCTDSFARCINLTLSPGTYTGNMEITLFTGCWTNSPTGYITNSYRCINNTSGVYSTEGLGLTPNTCYVAAIWTKDTGTFQICRQISSRPADDTCLGATTVSFNSTNYNTSCYSHDSIKEPNNTCVTGALRKSRWFKHTLTCDTFARFYYSGMNCIGGSSSYNISYFVGNCSALTYLSCNSAAGSNFTTTISGLSIGQTIYILVNGNNGASCSFNLRTDTPIIAKNATFNPVICSGKSIMVGGIPRTTTGTYKDTIWKMCNILSVIDSIRTFNLTVNPISTITIDTAICFGKSIFFKGQNRTITGTYRDTLVKTNGCDSFRILNLTIKPLSYRTIDTQICQGRSIFFNSAVRTTSGTYLDTLISANGCDSFITLNLTVNPTPKTNIFDTICQGNSRLFNGVFRTAAGIYRDTLITLKNCDSFIILNLTIKPISTKIVDTSICQGKSILFNGINRTTSGTYRDTFINSKGCDSFVILNLLIKTSSSNNMNSIICQGQSVFFKGQNRTVTGIFRDTLINSVGCDSFIILSLTVKPHSFTTLNNQICAGQSVVFNSVSRTTSGTYLDTLPSANGCDSFITLNLTVNPIQTTNIFDTICQGNSRLFNGISRTTAGVYRDTLLTSKNCDSFIILNLFVKSTSNKTIDTSICQGKFIFFNGQNRTATGSYRDTFVNSKGCDSIVILNLTVRTTSTKVIDTNICQGSFILFKGQNRSTSGTYRDTLINTLGCDSFVTLNLTVNLIKTTNLNASICFGKFYFFKGQNRTTAGTYRDTLKTFANCDSFVILNLTVLPSINKTIDSSICQGGFVFFKGLNRTMTGSYRDTIINPPNCDSIVILNLTVKNISTRNLFDTICQGQSVSFKGIPRTTTGVYRDTLTNAVGCDSFVILNLVVKSIPTINAGLDVSRINCSTDSVRLGTVAITGQTYSWSPSSGLSASNIAQPWAKPTSSTTYILDVTLSASGCKKTDTVNVTVLPSTVNASIRKYLRTCRGATGQSIGGTPTASAGIGPYTYIWTPNLYLNNNTIANPSLINTQHGIYTYVVQVTDSKGCIARDTTTIIIDSLPLNAAGRDTSLCRNSSLIIGKISQSKIIYSWSPSTNLSSANISNPSFNSVNLGIYQFILTTTDSANTCTLLDTVTIQVNPQKYDTLRPNICNGQSYFFNGLARTTAGTYFQTATSSKGCDSFIVLFLTVNNPSTKIIDSQICQGNAIFFKGQNRTTSGTYRDTLVNAKNCDSIITLNLTVNPTPTTNLNATICQGQSYFFKSIPRATAGVYRDTLKTTKNCDSFITLTLSVSAKSFRTIDTAICQGKTFLFKGQQRSISQTVIDTLLNALGCDSVVTLNLTIKDTSSNIIRDTICKNSRRFFNGIFVNTSGIYRDTLINSKGCDSFLYLQLYVKDTSSSQLFDTICSNQFRTFNGINRNSSGVYRDTLINAIGCDSFLYLNLFVKSTSSSTRNITICANQSYVFKGQNRTTPGVYYDTIPNSRGCDSFITLNLFVNTLSYRTIDTSICNGKTFFFKGQNRTTAGTFRDTLLNFNGCDSFVTLILAFKDTSYYSYSDTICQNKPLLFNGLFRNVAGNYKDTLINSKGCDSFVYLNLFVKNTSTTLLRDTICANSFYSFKGLNLNNPGVYRDTLINTQGCDSFVILTLIVHPTTSSNRTINICQGQSYIFKGKSEVTSGTYLDTLKNQYGCDSFISLNLIVNPLPIADAGIDQTRVNCDGDSTRLGANPIPSYGYLWSPSTGLPSVSAANPYTKTTIKTNYTLLVTNIITGCQSRDTVEIDVIQSQLNGSANAKDLRCHNDFSGQLYIKALNGYSPYYYKVDYMTSYSTSSLISNLSATPSSIFTIKDNKGCLFSDTFNIKQPRPIVINKLEQSDLKCFNDNSGKITVSVNGGTSPYKLSWDRSTSNDTIADKLGSGNHIFTVRDDSLCSKSIQFVLNEPKQISLLDTVIQKNPCFGDALGKIKAIATGGMLPYQYKWSSGQSGQEISQLKQGQYTLTLLDKNLCSDTVVLFLKDPGKLEFTFNKPSLDCRNLARLSIKAIEGTSPYFYSINNGLDYTRDSNFWINKTGHYKLSVRDNNGCLANDSLDIDYVKLLKINVMPAKKVIALSESVQLSFRVIEGDSSQIQSLIWTPSTGLNCSDCEAPLAAPYSSEVYTLNVKYANDCETRGQANIIVDGNNELFIPTAIYPFSEKLENTSFKIYTNNVLRAYLSIYNRWGEKLFETTEPHKNGWTGEYKGEMSTSGVYYYYLEITYLDGRKVVKKGEINLIR